MAKKGKTKEPAAGTAKGPLKAKLPSVSLEIEVTRIVNNINIGGWGQPEATRQRPCCQVG
jgi:hypothetical protein